MKLATIRLSNFQCFGSNPTEINFDDLTFLIGPNGSGKTAALQALCRMFAFDPALKRIQKSDFHVSHTETEAPIERVFWLEADFILPELLNDEGAHPAIPPHFAHIRLDENEEIPRVRFRLNATMGIDGDIEDTLHYVLELNPDGSPLNLATVSRLERNYIHVHYLPARRDPAEHIAYSTNALLGRLLRAVNWEEERETLKNLTNQISESMTENGAVTSLSNKLSDVWKQLHKGSYFADPSITFVASEIESVLRHLSVSFSPGHDELLVDFTRLSDGQKSMLYLSLVLTSQAIGRSVLNGDETFDVNKLRPAVFTIVALEEPENSLSPHNLGRIVTALKELTENEDAQAFVATHAPSMLRRIEPKNIRYLRLAENRETQVTTIVMPPVENEAHKFVREAVMAFPELYFARLVILGEGDSEEIVLPRILKAKGVAIDEFAISIVPLGGRHVNHFWRLLNSLKIPFLTLLDLDLARHQGGWGRIKYVNDQLGLYSPVKQLPADHYIPLWNDDSQKLMDFQNYLTLLENSEVFFSSPMDLDFAMLKKFEVAYGVDVANRIAPELNNIKAVLGDSYNDVDQYSNEEKLLFISYHKFFKLSSKPASHINALSKLTDAELLANMPDVFVRLADAVVVRLDELPE